MFHRVKKLMLRRLAGLHCRLADLSAGAISGCLRAFCLWPLLALPANGAATGSEVKKLADGVYAHVVSADSIFVANAGLVLMQDGALVFDAHFMPEAGEAWAKKIRDITVLPVRCLAFSHFHSDHTHGAQAFDRAGLIIASTNARRDMLEEDIPALERTVGLAQVQIDRLGRELDRTSDAVRQAELRSQLGSQQKFLNAISRIRIRAPVMCIDGSLTIADENRPAQFLLLGFGHTDGDIVLHLPRQRIVFAGDLFFNAALPNVEDASLLDWINTLEELLKLPADTFIPGHGAPSGRREVEDFRQYLRDLQALIEPAVERGDSLEEALRAARIPAKYAAYRFQNFFPANVRKMFAELKARQLSAPVTNGTETRKKPGHGSARPW